MNTIQGPAIFLAQFAGDAAPFNSLSAIGRWAASLGYQGVQIPSWDKRLFDLERAALSQDYCDEVKGQLAECGLAISELSTHLQGQLLAVHPAYDAAFDGFAAPHVRGQPAARQEWAKQQLLMAAQASQRLGLKAHATFSGALAWPYLYPWPQRAPGLVVVRVADATLVLAEPRTLGLEQNGQVQLAPVDQRRKVARQRLDKAHLDRRITRPHLGKERHAQNRRRARRHADAYLPRKARLTRRAGRFVDMPQGQLRLRQESKPRFGRNHARRRTAQEARRQLAFQTADLLAQGRGAEAKLGRCTSHAAQLDDTHEIAQLS